MQRIRFLSIAIVISAIASLFSFPKTIEPTAAAGPEAADTYAKSIHPLLKKFCLDCHSTKAKKGDLDLERFSSFDAVKKDLRPWAHIIEQLQAGEMPPKGKPQPSADEIKLLISWTKSTLDAEARARKGDPGRVPLRRLSNTEYDCTVRDLTGVDLKPAREFPADGAGGEGFTNAGESLSDITPPLFNRYLKAAKGISEHAVLLPDGFRFSPGKTRRDWTDESIARLRKFYSAYTSGDGKLPLEPYLAAAVRHRDTLLAGKLSPAGLAAKEKLNVKYFTTLWTALTDKTPSEPLDAIRSRWRSATERDIPALSNEVAAWQSVLWKTAKIGSYMRPVPGGYVENVSRQVGDDPPAAESVPLRFGFKPSPGQSEVTLYLAARDLSSSKGRIAWTRPRFEGPGKAPLLLANYRDFGPAFEIDYPSAFRETAKYLDAVVTLAHDPKQSADEVAKARGLDAGFLRHWFDATALQPLKRVETAKSIPAVPLTLLEERTPKNDKQPWIQGWRKQGTDLPVLVTNASDTPQHIPGRISSRGVGVHPMPKEFVAVAWKSPIDGEVRIDFRVTHAHPACGNGVAWWLEQRRGERSVVLGEGALDLGKEATPEPRSVKVAKGEHIVLAVDARDVNHVCDMTDIAFKITEAAKGGKTWNLAADIVNTVSDANPHADKYGNKETWSFVYGPSKGGGGSKGGALIPADSILGRWRSLATDPMKSAEARKLAEQAQALLSGLQPKNEKSPDRTLYDRFVAMDGALFKGVDVKKLATPRSQDMVFGLAKERFTGDDVVAGVDQVIEIRLPAALFLGREFVFDARSVERRPDEVVQVRVGTTAPSAGTRWETTLAAADAPAYKRLLHAYAEFRNVFPLFICFPTIVPTDEVVSLKMFHREDEPLLRLFLNDEEAKKVDHLWTELHFISRQAVAENDYLPQFIGYVTQDQPKEMVTFFENQRPAFKKRADAFLKEEAAAIPRQMDALLAFADRAFRRPLDAKQRTDLVELHKKIKDKGAAHDEAFRGVLSRILVSPAFLFRIENAAPGAAPGPIDDHELTSRLSYFLWSSMPDDELRRLADAGKLRHPKVIQEQVRRMLKDERARTLAIEFGTQWIHVRGFESLKEKNEKLFPTFDAKLRQAIYEESILFFLDLFQNDQPVARILDADYTFLNEELAKHYAIPGVTGPHWRKVDGVRKHGRGGVLGLASVHAKQSGASRTSPVLRGNWVVETLLGEKLPRPPADVPIIPDEEGADKRTTRQMVEKHTSVASCASCHVRIDPFGFAFENFDPIGRWRTTESSGVSVDTKAKLKDGTEFEGIEGLRAYLLKNKKDVVIRLFCQRLLGYALGRATTLSDTSLIDEMVAELDKHEGRIGAAVLTIVRSPQFRMIRGAESKD